MPNPVSPDLTRAARLLWAPVPKPARPRPKPRKSRKKLTVGQTLRLLQLWHTGSHTYPAGTLFTVCKPITDQGVGLVVKKDEAEVLCSPAQAATVPPLRWTREWVGQFEKVRRKAVRKKKPAKENK